jgi:hypothetical protein
MSRIPVLLKRMLDWLVIFVGIVSGIIGLVLLGFRADRGVDPWFELFVVPVAFPLFSSVVAITNRKRAAFLLLVLAPAIGTCVTAGLGLRLWLAHDAVASEILTVWIIVLAIPVCLGLFWFATYRYGWSPIVRARPASLARKIATISLGSLGLILVVWAGIFAWAVQPYFIGDCSGYDPPFVRQQSANHAVFIAKVIYVGDSGYRAGHKLGAWAIVKIEQRFWGLSRWNRRYAVLTQGAFETGQEYFVGGHLRDGLLTGFLIVEASLCRQPASLKDAEVELRLLHDGPPKNGVRIIGSVRHYQNPDETMPGVRVVVTGPTRSVTTSTDEHGTYDVSGLPPGRYSIRTDTYDEKSQGYPSCGLGSENPNLNAGDVWGCTIKL